MCSLAPERTKEPCLDSWIHKLGKKGSKKCCNKPLITPAHISSWQDSYECIKIADKKMAMVKIKNDDNIIKSTFQIHDGANQIVGPMGVLCSKHTYPVFDKRTLPNADYCCTVELNQLGKCCGMTNDNNNNNNENNNNENNNKNIFTKSNCKELELSIHKIKLWNADTNKLYTHMGVPDTFQIILSVEDIHGKTHSTELPIVCNKTTLEVIGSMTKPGTSNNSKTKIKSERKTIKSEDEECESGSNSNVSSKQSNKSSHKRMAVGKYGKIVFHDLEGISCVLEKKEMETEVELTNKKLAMDRYYAICVGIDDTGFTKDKLMLRISYVTDTKITFNCTNKNITALDAWIYYGTTNKDSKFKKNGGIESNVQYLPIFRKNWPNSNDSNNDNDNNNNNTNNNDVTMINGIDQTLSNVSNGANITERQTTITSMDSINDNTLISNNEQPQNFPTSFPNAIAGNGDYGMNTVDTHSNWNNSYNYNVSDASEMNSFNTSNINNFNVQPIANQAPMQHMPMLLPHETHLHNSLNGYNATTTTNHRSHQSFNHFTPFGHSHTNLNNHFRFDNVNNVQNRHSNFDTESMSSDFGLFNNYNLNNIDNVLGMSSSILNDSNVTIDATNDSENQSSISSSCSLLNYNNYNDNSNNNNHNFLHSTI